MSDDVESYMDGTNAGNLDLYFPLVRSRSIHRIRNRMAFTPIDISIYLLRCRQETPLQPQAVIFRNWNDETPTSAAAYAPVLGTPLNYTWPISQDILAQNDPTGVQVDMTINAEVSMQLGVTPQWSPTFNEYWEVCKVMKQRLKASDILEFHFEQEYGVCHSLNDFIANFTNAPGEVIKYNRYTTGDYELLITFNGLPGTCEGNIEGTTLNVDALKSRISKTVSHSLSYAWPTLAKGDSTQSVEPDELFKKGWITSTEKTTNLQRRMGYFKDGYNPLVTTNQSEKEGGGI